MQQLAEKQAEILIKEKIAEGAEKKEIMHILQIGSCPEGVAQELWKDHCSVTRLDLRNMFAFHTGYKVATPLFASESLLTHAWSL